MSPGKKYLFDRARSLPGTPFKDVSSEARGNENEKERGDRATAADLLRGFSALLLESSEKAEKVLRVKHGKSSRSSRSRESRGRVSRRASGSDD